MDATDGDYLRITSEALDPGTTVRYHHRNGDSLATVTEATDEHVAFVGDDCDGQFTREQIDRMIRDGRLKIVLGDAERNSGAV